MMGVWFILTLGVWCRTFRVWKLELQWFGGSILYQRSIRLGRVESDLSAGVLSLALCPDYRTYVTDYDTRTVFQSQYCNVSTITNA
jgi:hypothetical protein